MQLLLIAQVLFKELISCVFLEWTLFEVKGLFIKSVFVLLFIKRNIYES